MASLGGPDTHHKKSGVCRIVADDELDARAQPPPGRRICQRGHFDRSRPRPARSTSNPAARVGPPGLRRAPLVEALLDSDSPFEEFQSKVGPVDGDQAGSAGRAHRRRAGQQPAAPGRLPELRKCRRQHVSCVCATRSASPRWSSWTCPVICPASTRWGGVVRRGANCCTRSVRPPSPRHAGDP